MHEENVKKIDRIANAIGKVNCSLKSLTKSLSELKEASPELHEQFKKAMYIVSEDK